ncbi:hypothetical protein NE237_027050 [Protea cynaroides]|uniref:Uncharacterized protein n=1 Tax=Protea cynaroides TaxID=273540 RepID=A0A9Q0GM74_9MAGN|nr:hypothetical protein NE237_027050 [Protea cynaroides]
MDMAGLQRSTISFRRQGSSGLVWDDPVLSVDVNQKKQKEGTEFRESRSSRSVENSQRGGGRGSGSGSGSGSGNGSVYRTDKMVSPSMDPPSPKMSSCGCCAAFKKPEKKAKRRNF